MQVEGTTMPTMAWLKSKIIEWLELHRIPLPVGVNNFNMLTKPSLIKLSKDHPVRPIFVVEQLAEQSGKEIRILWLPPAHCEFSPIELVWAFVKNYVTTNNTTKNLAEMQELTRTAVEKVTPGLWQACIRHVEKYEKNMWERDHLHDSNIATEPEAFVIQVEEGDTTSESDDNDSTTSDELSD